MIMMLSIACAEEGIYMEDISGCDKSLTLTLKCGDTLIDGAEFSLYQIADAEVKNGRCVYSLTSDFSEIEVDLGELTTKESIALAKTIDTTGKKAAATGITDEEGVVSFGRLKEGLYLVKQTDKTNTATKYESLDAYIVAVPHAEINADTGTGTWIYDVVSIPKTRIMESPKTGDTFNPMWIVVALVSLAGALALLNRTKRQD